MSTKRLFLILPIAAAMVATVKPVLSSASNVAAVAPASRSVVRSLVRDEGQPIGSFPTATRSELAFQSVGDSLIEKYQTLPGFVGVSVEKNSLKVRLSSTPILPSDTKINSIPVIFESSPYSLRELQTAVEKLKVSVPESTGIALDIFKPSVVVYVKDPTQTVLRPSSLPGLNVPVSIEKSPNLALDMVQGGERQDLRVGPGVLETCTSGFRVNGSYISGAAHCPNQSQSWQYPYTGGSDPINLTSETCSVDTQAHSAPYGTDARVQGVPVTGAGNPLWGTLIWHYGAVTSWTNGYQAGYLYTSNGGGCPGVNLWVVQFGGGTYARAGGDSGGLYITIDGNGTGFVARGTHFGGTTPNVGFMVPIGSITAAGYSIG